MGRLKEWWLESQMTRTEKLADALEISLLDLEQLDFEIEIDSSKEGLVYGYRVVFSEDSPHEILEQIPGLENGNTVYLAPSTLEDHYDYDEQFNAVTANTDYREHFFSEIENLKSLLSIELDSKALATILRRQVFIGVIGSMETFLSDAFINETLSEEYFFRRFVESHPAFGKRKFELKDIFVEREKIKETAKEVMLDTNYHNLSSVRKMFQSTFEIVFPDIAEAQKYVSIRHDLVHRNGKTKDGEKIVLDDDLIEGLFKCIGDLVNEVSNSLVFSEVPF